MNEPERPLDEPGTSLYPRSQSCFTCQGREAEWCVLEEEQLRLLSRGKVSNTYQPGQVVFYQGNPCLGIHCIESGTVGLRKVNAQGHSLLARLFHTGDTLGYLAYFSGRGYTGTAEALTECRVCFIDRAALRSLLDQNPRLGEKFLQRVADNLKEAEDAKLALVALPLRVRLAHLLLTFKDRFGKGTEDGSFAIDLPLTRADLASMLGARPESVSRAIRQLQDGGVARFDGRKVAIDDLDLLLDECESHG